MARFCNWGSTGSSQARLSWRVFDTSCCAKANQVSLGRPTLFGKCSAKSFPLGRKTILSPLLPHLICMNSNVLRCSKSPKSQLQATISNRNKLVKQRDLQKSEFFRTKFWVNFVGDFLVDFFGPFPWKNRRKKSSKNPRQNPKQNRGVLRPKSTLQGSSLENYRRKNVQQLTCKMVWSFSFCSLLVSFRLFVVKPLNSKKKSWRKNSEKP